MHFITNYRSLNFNDRPKEISHIVLHYTDLPDHKESLKVLCDPAKKVSAHFLIDVNGDIYQLVNVVNRAWHAGVSIWNGIENVNDYSIGIELQNTGHSVLPLQPYPKVQMERLVKLLDFLCKTYHLDPSNVIGHSDIAPDRKRDPGEHFDWYWLYQEGFGKKR